MEGLEHDFSVSNTPSSKSEELYQQCVSPHLSQNSQYLHRNLLSCSPSPSSSMYMGVFEDFRGIPKPLTCWYIGFRCIIFGLHVCHLVGCSPLSGHNIAPSISLFPCMILFCPGLNVLDHAEFSPCSFNFTSTSRDPAGILQNRYPSRSQAVFSNLLDAILKLKFASISVVCDSNAGSPFMGVCYSHSLSRLYLDFLCFSMMYTCIRFLLPNNFLTFNL